MICLGRRPRSLSSFEGEDITNCRSKQLSRLLDGCSGGPDAILFSLYYYPLAVFISVGIRRKQAWRRYAMQERDGGCTTLAHLLSRRGHTPGQTTTTHTLSLAHSWTRAPPCRLAMATTTTDPSPSLLLLLLLSRLQRSQ